MFKVFVVVTVSVFCINTIVAQDKILIVEGASPNIYLTHKIEPKENYYSIGRMYNVPPKELAPFNSLDFEKGLSLGQDIKIPLAQNNFTQEAAPKNGEVLIPLYHIIEAKEGLYRVSTNYNKVPLQQLKNWNNLTSDIVSNGTKLIIGFLRVQKGQSTLTNPGETSVKDVASVTREEEPQLNTKAAEPKDAVHEVKIPAVEKAADPVLKNKPAMGGKATEVKTAALPAANISFNGGRFKKIYEDQMRGRTAIAESGSSGVLKVPVGGRTGNITAFIIAHRPAQL